MWLESGTRCRNGIKVLWCCSCLVWLLFGDSISICTCKISLHLFLLFKGRCGGREIGEGKKKRGRERGGGRGRRGGGEGEREGRGEGEVRGEEGGGGGGVGEGKGSMYGCVYRYRSVVQY